MDALKPYKIDAKYINLVNDYLNGVTIQELSDIYQVEPDEISSFINRKEVQSYISTQLQNYGFLNPLSRVKLLNSIIEQKIRLAEETDTPLSKKDITEIIKLLQQEQQMLQKANKPDEPLVNVNYLQLVQELVDDE